MKRSRQGIPFWKVQGAGNDALIVESRHFPRNKPAFVRRFAHRSLGVGADQVLEVLRRGPLPEIRFWNRDGSRAEMCANGTRSFLRFALEERWIRRQKELSVLAAGRLRKGWLGAGGKVELSLGKPEINPMDKLSVGGRKFSFTPVSTGNPHAVIFLPQAFSGFDYRIYGAAIEAHRKFPKKTNVEFVRKVRVRGRAVELTVEAWERGAGATLSCGTGAVAAAAAHRASCTEERRKNLYYVKMTSFTLTVRFKNTEAFLSGPSSTIAEGLYCFQAR